MQCKHNAYFPNCSYEIRSQQHGSKTCSNSGFIKKRSVVVCVIVCVCVHTGRLPTGHSCTCPRILPLASSPRSPSTCSALWPPGRWGLARLQQKQPFHRKPLNPNTHTHTHTPSLPLLSHKLSSSLSLVLSHNSLSTRPQGNA